MTQQTSLVFLLLLLLGKVDFVLSWFHDPKYLFAAINTHVQGESKQRPELQLCILSIDKLYHKKAIGMSTVLEGLKGMNLKLSKEHL